MNFGFERPLLLVLGPLFFAGRFLLSRFFRDILTLAEPLGPPGGVPYKAPARTEFFIRLFRALESLGLLLLFTAAAGPRFIIPEQVWLDRGADVFFVLDISPSMAALDMDEGSRLEAAKKLVLDFALRRPSDAIGLAAVGTEASLVLPPTIDREMLAERLGGLEPGALGDSTALGLGLAVAALHLRNSAAPRRAAALITDGENNAGAVHPETAAETLKKNGVSLWVIGVGSSGEVPIDYVDPLTKVRRRGKLESRFNPETLRAIARAGGGTWLSAPSASAFETAFNRLDEGEFTVRRSGTVYSEGSLLFPALAAALALVFLSRFAGHYYLGALF